MTNKEWLTTLPARELSHVLYSDMCDICIFDESKCGKEGKSCYSGILAWLKAEHEEPRKDFTETELSAAIDLFFSDRRAVGIDELKQMVRGLFE